MKTALKLSLIAAPFVLIAAAHAASTTGSIGATIMTPISAQELTPMTFGTVLPSGTAGTVSTVNGQTTNGIVVVSGTVAPDTFSVSGSNGMGYSVTGNPTATISAGSGKDMTVDLTYPTGTTLDSNGSGTFAVQGLLHVGATQAGGNYSGTYPVNVNY